MRKCKDLPVGLPRYLGNAGREPELATLRHAFILYLLHGEGVQKNFYEIKQ